MHGVQRPLSPYWIYRWEITMWLSSLHRITGLLLSRGAVVLGIWLIAAGERTRELSPRVQQVLAAPWFKLLLVGWAFCFFFHLSNGVRHLAWDTGCGLRSRSASARRGWTVVVGDVAGHRRVLFARDHLEGAPMSLDDPVESRPRSRHSERCRRALVVAARHFRRAAAARAVARIRAAHAAGLRLRHRSRLGAAAADEHPVDLARRRRRLSLRVSACKSSIEDYVTAKALKVAAADGVRRSRTWA